MAKENITSKILKNGTKNFYVRFMLQGKQYPVKNFTNLAEWFVDEGWLGEVSDKLLMYIDYEKLGRDIMLDGNYHETKNGILEERN